MPIAGNVVPTVFSGLDGGITQVAATVGNHHDFDGVRAKSVYDAITLIYHFPDVRVVGFRHHSSALRELR